jgi:O-acetyl-ADP-ribose deacetylase (regulator of RNase III)
MPLIYVKGDATEPQGNGPKIIAHCCNDLGRWGAGFVVMLGSRWPVAKEAYISWYKDTPNVPGEVTGRIALGESQLIKVEENLWVANIVGQHGIGVGGGGKPPIRYNALRKGFAHVYRWATIYKASVHAPRLGSGLAGGHWGNIEALLKTEIADKGVEVFIYDL